MQGIIPRSVRYISFDAGFTLIRPLKPVGFTYAQAAERFGYCLDPERVNDNFFRVWEKYNRAIRSLRGQDNPQVDAEKSYLWWKDIFFESLGIKIRSEDKSEMFDYCYSEFAKGTYWVILSGIKESLKLLLNRGYKLVVLSNWDDRLKRTLRELNLEGFFSDIFVSTRIGFAKPDPDAFGFVVSSLGIDKTEILHIGDSWFEDYYAARNAGLTAIWFKNGQSLIDKLG
jgi:putative hydrolase of the HAD superfamily